MWYKLQLLVKYRHLNTFITVTNGFELPVQWESLFVCQYSSAFVPSRIEPWILPLLLSDPSIDRPTFNLGDSLSLHSRRLLNLDPRYGQEKDTIGRMIGGFADS